ncbi:hypothetical protein CE91St46_25750 [Eubacteriales bacterium]|nr:hypothetical protein CE91St46_25750 [Eubacteriales bacterium]GKH64183.1 hypothetical protein CE91St47_26520 [Eubacteriales bacterium]
MPAEMNPNNAEAEGRSLPHKGGIDSPNGRERQSGREQIKGTAAAEDGWRVNR